MSDSDAEEDFVLFGTPLEPIEDDDVKRKKPTPIEEQIVTDEQGRRRFHGAFTGGFSAGFFNTVGSRDGWSPATFVSSRSNRSAAPKQRMPEQFMDEHDVGEFGFAPKGVTATESFKSRSEESKQQSRKRKRLEAGPEVIPGASILEDIITPVRDSKGMLLLKKMGWKPGQGIGPRVRPEEKAAAEESADDSVRVYGCFVPEEFRSRLSDYEGDGQLTFAPDDVPAWKLVPKKDLFGLGYTGLKRGNVLGMDRASGPRLVMKEKGNRRVNITGQAFGVGAFEEDDDDIYSTEDMSNYDFDLTSEAEKAKRKAGSSRSGDGNQDPYRRLEGDDFPGFSLSRTTVKPKLFAPPAIPNAYKPVFRMYPSCKGLREPGSSRWDILPGQTKAPPTAGSKPGLGRHSMTIGQRAEALGEKRPQTAESVAKTVRPSTPEKPQIAQDSGPSSSFSTLAVAPVKEEVSAESRARPKLRPFARDEAKRKRYEQYLVLRRNKRTDQLRALQPPEMPDAECAQEKAMFERAATVYEPLNSGIASRFVSGGTTDSLAEPEIEPDMKAAQMKMYGKLTRVVVDWYPGDLLCRRFNVKNPHPECKEAQELSDGKEKKEKPSLFSFLLEEKKPAGFSSTFQPVQAREEAEPAGEAIVDMKPFTIGGAKVEESHQEVRHEVHQTDETEEVGDSRESGPKKPSIDLFKAIFDESSDEDGEEASSDVEASREAKKPLSLASDDVHRKTREPSVSSVGPEPPPPPIVAPVVSIATGGEEDASSSLPGGSGIFANLDLAELEEKWKARTRALFDEKAAPAKSESPAPKDKGVAATEPGPILYGPALPTSGSSHAGKEQEIDKSSFARRRDSSSDEDSYESSSSESSVEDDRRSKKDKKKSSSKRHSRSRKDSKKKKKKTKKKHKHKSSKSRRS